MYLFSGALDTVVSQKVVQELQKYYTSFVSASAIVADYHQNVLDKLRILLSNNDDDNYFECSKGGKDADCVLCFLFYHLNTINDILNLFVIIHDF